MMATVPTLGDTAMSNTLVATSAVSSDSEDTGEHHANDNSTIQEVK